MKVGARMKWRHGSGGRGGLVGGGGCLEESGEFFVDGVGEIDLEDEALAERVEEVEHDQEAPASLEFTFLDALGVETGLLGRNVKFLQNPADGIPVGFALRVREPEFTGADLGSKLVLEVPKRNQLGGSGGTVHAPDSFEDAEDHYTVLR